jgi:hypothetical protein
VSGPPLLLALALAAAPPPSASAPGRLRLEGLDRLYFARVGGAERLNVPAEVSVFLPLALARSAPLPDPEKLPEISVADIPLPVPRWPRPALLRQVARSGARIDELWLALYDGGRRSDVWYFEAMPGRTDGKLLANYRVRGARAGEGGTVVLHLDGSMYRPQGGWWINAKDVTFAVRGDALAVQHVRGAYGFIHDYDRLPDDGRAEDDEKEEEPAFSVTVEREVEGRFERRDLYPVTAAAIKACGGDVEGDHIEPGAVDLETVAACVTRDPKSTVTQRRLDEPSFAERGYKPRPE